MITNFKLFEGVKWYSKGKLTKDDSWEDEPDNVFKVGDKVLGDENIYWDDGLKGKIDANGEWVNTHYHNSGDIFDIDYCENKDGYTGQIIKIKNHWPWFQTTNFKHVN